MKSRIVFVALSGDVYLVESIKMAYVAAEEVGLAHPFLIAEGSLPPRPGRPPHGCRLWAFYDPGHGGAVYDDVLIARRVFEDAGRRAGVDGLVLDDGSRPNAESRSLTGGSSQC